MELRILEKLDNIIKLLQGKSIPDGWMDIKQVVEYSSLNNTKKAIKDTDNIQYHYTRQ